MTHRYCAALAAIALGFAPSLAQANTESLRPVVRPLTLQAMNIVEVAARGNETIGAVRPKLRTEAVTNAVEKDVNPRDSWRAGKEFRLHIIRTLTQRVIRQAVARAGGKF